MFNQDIRLWTAVVTPFNDDKSIDFYSFEKIIHDQDQASNGILVLGSTGESLSLSVEEKKQIVEKTIELNPTSPIMVGVGGVNYRENLEWLKWLESKDIDCYLLTSPIYTKPGMNGQYQFFKDMLDAVTRPCMIYNIPGRAAISVNVEAIEKLNNHKNFWAIKEASGKVEEMIKFKNAAKNQRIFCGDDGLMPEFAKAGAYGLVSVAGNAWPHETNLYVEQCLAQKLSNKENEMWKDASNSLFIASNPVPVKNLMYSTDKITTMLMREPLSHLDLNDRGELDRAQLNVTEWFKSFSN